MTDEGNYGSVIEQCWAALDAEQASGEHRFRTAALPETGSAGGLSLAVDYAGHRHVLVPVPSHRKIRSGLNGPALTLSKRTLEDETTLQAFADLACLRDDLDDLFTKLCVDFVQTVREMPTDPVKSLYRVLDRWKALFRTTGAPLGAEQLAGLFGELTVLNKLLEIDPSAHRLWRGPTGYRHDFSNDRVAFEVKTSTSSEGRRPRIHGLDQLEAPDGGTLSLVWFRVERVGHDSPGAGIVELVERAFALCDDESSLAELLAQTGYRAADAERYRSVRFAVVEERWYSVDDQFPQLTGHELATAGITVSVIDVEYSIDLSGALPAPIEPDLLPALTASIVEESA